MASTTPPKAPVRTAFIASARSASIKSTATTGSNASGVGIGSSGGALGLGVLGTSNSGGGFGGLGLSGRVAFEPPTPTSTPATPSSAGPLSMLYVTSVVPIYSLNDYVAPLRKGASGSGSGTGTSTVNGAANSTVGANGIGGVEDRIQFARTLRPESSEFMGLWMYAHTHGAGAALVFYKEAVLLLDALAAATPAPNNDRFVAERFSAARLVGLTPPVTRFLFASNKNTSNISSSSSSYIIPPIPPTFIPPSLRYPFESLINSHILASSSASPPLPGVSLKSRNALFQLVSSNAPLPSSVLDDVLDELLIAMFEGVYAQYVHEIGEYQHNLQVIEIPSENTADRTRAASSNSSYKQKNDDETSSIHQKILLAKTDRRTSAAQQSLAGDDPSPISKKDPTPSPNLKLPEVPLYHQQQQQSQQPSQPVFMLYSKVANDNSRELNRVMEFAGFKDRKDSEKLLLEFSRACFIKIMDKNSSSYKDFSQYAKANKFQNHINFYEQICKFDDMVACLTPTVDATLVKTYSRVRNEFGITQPLSRFIKSTQDPDPTYQRLQRLPSLPSIPCSPVPNSLKTTVIDIYGTFIGRDSRQEITFSPTRRPAVQSALQQDFLRPIETDLLDGCADEVVDALYEQCFKKYVIDNGGSMVPKSEFAGLSVFTTVAGSVTSASSTSASTGPVKKMNLKKSSANGEGFFTGFFNKPKQLSTTLQRSDSTSSASFPKSNNSGVSPGYAAAVVSPVALPTQSAVKIEMLYEIQPKKELTTQYMEVSKTRSSFLNAMRLDGLLFKQIVQFASSNRAEFKSFHTVLEDGSDTDPSAGNLKFYQAICNLEDQIASITPSENPEDAIFYRSARADGLNQSLNRFLIQSDAIDLTISTLPAIPAHPISTRLRPQFINIYTTYISETAPVDVSISTVKRVSVQLAIQQENIIPLMTNIFDDCIDEVMQTLYEQTFMRFVARKSVSSVGTGLSQQPLNGMTASTVVGEISVSTFSRKFTDTASRSGSPLVESPISNVNSPLLSSLSPVSPKNPPAPFAPSNRSLKGKARSGKGSDGVLLI
ncbi:hypothetical protein HK100_006049 [Physocladia obscura]|uniref:RGS domain-containing protein n=1 Tax=Physocladia obscura TaxID=109957 RepID=A0AAD5XBJ8_9FUNG|nr:hypothetical protein HK100_006049 [Physocladia obscura]